MASSPRGTEGPFPPRGRLKKWRRIKIWKNKKWEEKKLNENVENM